MRHAQQGLNRAPFETAPLISLVLLVCLSQCSLTFDPCTPPPFLFSSAKPSNPGYALTCAFVQDSGYMSALLPHEIAQSVLPEGVGQVSGKEAGGKSRNSHCTSLCSLETGGGSFFSVLLLNNELNKNNCESAILRSQPLHLSF